MKVLKRLLPAALAALMCVSMAACSGAKNGTELTGDIAGDDWRTTGIVRDSGVITRNGEDTAVLVCVHAKNAAFYYDEKEQQLYGQVDYPMTLPGEPWDEFQSIDFTDRNGDGDGDVAILFSIDGNSALMVWLWDADAEEYIYQPQESIIPTEA